MEPGSPAEQRGVADRPVADDATAGAALSLRLLGGFHLRLGAEVIADGRWRLLKARALVKLLALAPGHRLPREQLLDTLWPEADADAARRNFNYALHVARRALDGAPGDGRASRRTLHLQDGILTLLTTGTIAVDVERFTVAVALARQTRDPAAYRAALAHYGGDLLPDDRYEEWASAPRERLHELFLAALIELARLLRARGERTEAVDALHRVLVVAPAHEEAHTLLMRLHDEGGRRALALRQYAQLREALGRELAVEPDPETQHLYGAILAGQTRRTTREDERDQEAAGAESARAPLPVPLTTFIGRERELDEVEQLLHGAAAQARLITLTGAGGCGKTRLALEVARRAHPHYAARLWLAELAPLDEPARLPAVVARTLGLREQPGVAPIDLVIQALQGRPALLILDNCEHLRDACAQLAAALLGACPALHILATSRVALRVGGELVWRVPVLALPDPPPVAPYDATQLASMVGGDAVRLLLDRVTLRVPDFRLTAENAAAVAAICRRLDGLPLALELAAGRLPALSVEELAARLDDALGVVARGDHPTPARQQTLRATLDWSHALLAPHEAALLSHLAIFADSWGLAAAEAICDVGAHAAHDGAGTTRPPAPIGTPRPSLLDALARLVDQSLVTVTTVGGATRYALLEIVRQYAREHLVARGEMDSLLQRHAAWYLALAQEANAGLAGVQQVRWLRRLEIEHANLRAGLRWALAHEATTVALQLCAALWPFWESHSYLAEGYDWCARALALPGGSPEDRAAAILGAGRLAYCRNDIPAARRHLTEVVARARSHDDRPLLAAALTHLGHVVLIDDRAAARRLYTESLALGGALGDRRGEALNLSGLGNVAIREQEYATARPLLEAALERANDTGLQGEAAFVLRCLGRIAFAEGELPTAQRYYERCIAGWRELGNRREVAMFQSESGHLALAQGRHEEAAQLLSQSLDALRDLAIPQRFPYSLEGLAALATVDGRPIRALRLAAAAAALRARYGSTMPEIEGTHIARAIADAHAALGAAAGATAWKDGLTLATDDALSEALTRA